MTGLLVQCRPVAGGPDALSLKRYELWKQGSLCDYKLVCSGDSSWTEQQSEINSLIDEMAHLEHHCWRQVAWAYNQETLVSEPLAVQQLVEMLSL